MSPQAFKNIRVLGYILLSIAAVLAIFIPVTYYSEKDRFENSQIVSAEIIDYPVTSHTKGESTITQLVRVRFTDPATNQIKVATSTLVAINTATSDNRVEIEQKKNALPAGTITKGFYHAKSDRLTIASELPNGELVKPGTTIPFLVKLLVPFAVVGALMVFLGKKS